ncbi:MAG: ATP-binding protein [Streptosporangiales bacterium]|nr:ATP-binding protein [Streptosporangiales bacterium]
MRRRSPLAKPAHVFGREAEWRALGDFATRTTASAEHAMLGVVSGRRRMGKTYLLRALVAELGGFYFGATAATRGESLRSFGAALAAHAGAAAPYAFETWDDAITTLFGLARADGRDRPLVVVIDEFPYLTKMAPELPSIVQREIDRYQQEPSRMRLLLCGSAMSVMGGLLAGHAPLRGRAQLELIVRPFPYREAARFWNVDGDPALATRLHAVVGGTPAYRRQFLNDDVPEGLGDFDDWVCRTVLSPFTPLFRESRYLLAEEMEIRDNALYHSVLAAVAAGNTTRGGIANYIGRKAVDISHPLQVLEDSHLLAHEADVFRPGRAHYRITEPLINFYEAVMRPEWPLLEAGGAEEVWARSKERFAAQVAGPHFEVICRDYTLREGRRLLGGSPGRVGCGLVYDPSTRSQTEIDVGVIEPGDGGSRQAVRLLGEVKWGTVMGAGHLDRLRRARDVLAARGLETGDCALACYSAAGFTDALRAESEKDDVHLIGLSELYEE